jgi:hypothetical protein
VFVEDGGYKGLVQYPPLKTPDFNDWPERDGIEVDLTDPKLDSKTFGIKFAGVQDFSVRNLIDYLSDDSYDGTYFQDEAGFNSSIARTYQVSGDGRSFIRTDTPAKSKREGSVELTEIYPMREGTVTNVLWYYKDVEYTTYATALAAAKADEADGGSVFCDIFDNTIPAALDYSVLLQVI